MPSQSQYCFQPYRLEDVYPELIDYYTLKVNSDLREGGLKYALDEATSHEDPSISGCFYYYGDHLRQVYGEGGAEYAIFAAVGLSALREENPGVAPIVGADWDAAQKRERELTLSRNFRVVEDVVDAAFKQIRFVNPGYVQGFEEFIKQKRAVAQTAGFCALGMLHAHDMLHFAALRSKV